MDANSPHRDAAAVRVKREALRRLAEARRSDPLDGYAGDYLRFADFDCECEHVVPWTISAEVVHADLMLIAQDWASEDFLSGLSAEEHEEQRRTGQISRLATNVNIRDKVLPRFGPTFAETYATDAFAFVKRGAMTAPLPFADLVRSTAAYALPQIGIVRPKMVLCLGSRTFNAVRRAILQRSGDALPPGGRRWIRLAESWRIADPFHTDYEGIPVFGIAHPGGQGTRASGGPKTTEPRLEALAAFFAVLVGSSAKVSK
jgi:restriction system protein